MMFFTLYITYDGMILFLWKILKLKIECWDKISLLARGQSPALSKIILKNNSYRGTAQKKDSNNYV